MFSFSVEELTLAGLLYIILEVFGISMAVHAILYTRTSQGAIAWALSLVTAPLIALPLYAFFGRRKFQGYVESRRVVDLAIQKQTELRLETHWQPFSKRTLTRDKFVQSIEKLSGMHFTGSNTTELLINGENTFSAIFAAIANAQQYILVEFFIVHDDELGRDLQKRLIEKQHQGVQVYFLYDSIGSYALPQSYSDTMTEAGIQVRSFGRPGRYRNRFQVNFRNHRKIVVVDGKSGFTGGHNVGNEYLGKSRRFGGWRDTHIKLSGPSVMGLQTAFLEDWTWVTGEFPDLTWEPTKGSQGGSDVMVIPSGPADDLETCSLFFVLMLNTARQRAWLASPYFVPNEAVMEALKLAALRGVDVRIMLPEKPDKRTAWLAAFAYIEEARTAGVAFYRYQNGFMHQKTMLIDDDLAVVGTANLDNRSFRLNFELSVLVSDQNFAGKVEKMMVDDFAMCRLVSKDELERQTYLTRIAIAGSRLLSPIL